MESRQFLGTCSHQLMRSILTKQINNLWNNCHGSICGFRISACVSDDINHYDTLGIEKSSTQRDIKDAYYKLSMLYHPDKNQGSADAAQKFREISKAYEVLGNYKSRRLYDKGAIHLDDDFSHRTHESNHASPMPGPEDDGDTKFYKSRFRKSTVTVEGRTPIYNFDEWSRSHYGKTFERRQKAKTTYNNKEAEKVEVTLSMQNQMVFFGLAFCLFASYMVFREETANDTPNNRTKTLK